MINPVWRAGDVLVKSTRSFDASACHAEGRGADARRDSALREAEYRVLRIEVQLVMRSLSEAVPLVRAAL
ncbi:MAG TPA: hypothetical protein VER12_15300 [Polyangiaceae bacterium]|nr:hypothetical protein [Polyangiaceae bacterium]